MARFPFKQADVVELAESVLKGLKDNKDIYPAPWVTLADFEAAIEKYHKADEKLTQAKNARKAATAKYQNELNGLMKMTKKQLRYAEVIVDYDNEKLELLGWGGRKKRTPKLTPPVADRSENNASAETDNE